VIKEPLRRAASTTRVPKLKPAMMRLRRGKFPRRGGVPGANSLTKCPLPLDLLVERPVAPGIDDVDARTEYAQGDPLRPERPLVRAGVDSLGHAAVTLRPRSPRCSANARAVSRPWAVGLRLPTTANCGSASAPGLPDTKSATGHSGVDRSSAGKRGSVNGMR